MGGRRGEEGEREGEREREREGERERERMVGQRVEWGGGGGGLARVNTRVKVAYE